MIRTLQVTFLLVAVCFFNTALAHDGLDSGGISTSFESEVEVQIADFPNGKSETKFLVKDNNGKKKELQFPAGMKQPTLMSGQRIQVKGHVHGNKPDAVLLDQQVQALGGIDSTSTTSTATAVAAAPQARTAVAIITEFADASVSCTDQAVTDTLFGAAPIYSMANYYLETSKNLLSFSGAVVRVKLAANMGTTCDYNGWASAARTEAAKQISLSGYNHTITVLPSNAPCGWSGLGTLGWGSTWVKTCGYGSVFTHEIGHNLNMHHAGTPGAEYGDGSDVMGSGYAPVNAMHSIQRGWTPSANVIDVKSSGVYKITALESDPLTATSPQVLKIFKEDTGQTYYFSLRQRIGMFGTRYISTTFADRLSVHLGGLEQVTRLVGTRGLNEPYADAVNGISVTPIALNGNQLDVQVSITATCVRGAPTLSVSPPSSVIPGAAQSAYATIMNNDNYWCPPSTFNVSATASSTLGTVSVSSPSLVVQPKSGMSYTVNIQTASTTPLGSYPVTTTAVDTMDGSRAPASTFSVTVGSGTTSKGKGRGRLK
jgi:hypothetical protein